MGRNIKYSKETSEVPAQKTINVACTRMIENPALEKHPRLCKSLCPAGAGENNLRDYGNGMIGIEQGSLKRVEIQCTQVCLQDKVRNVRTVDLYLIPGNCEETMNQMTPVEYAE
ncbi:hypothetical protein CHS0354_032456 [Potamilus streckersoni]|uniref:Uncharacterized protein n=1 Tax=Potamilus streckersoni TaxID=2493646 RepID=A0AAE0SQR9_9BIVA|nr:hypothetical protein CHS0354_032456 [Potamilus streckersoni]